MTWVDVTIAEVVQESPLDRSFVLAVPRAQREAFDFAPGQYLQLRDPADPAGRDWYFSLSAAPNARGTLRVTIRGRGDAVQPMYTAAAGTTWRARPPAGAFRLEGPEPEERVVLAGAGSGVTPFRAFVEQQVRADDVRPVWLLQCARTPEELLFRAEFEAWSEASAGFHYAPTVTGEAERWTGRSGRIDEAFLGAVLGDPQRVRLYACGPRTFVDAVLAAAAALGVPPERRLEERH